MIISEAELPRLYDKQASRNTELEVALNKALCALSATTAVFGALPLRERSLIESAKEELARLAEDNLSSRRARHEPLLKRLVGVSEQSVDTFLACSREELESRAFVQLDWLQLYAKCLDGLELTDFKDGARLPEDIRRAVQGLIKSPPAG